MHLHFAFFRKKMLDENSKFTKCLKSTRSNFIELFYSILQHKASRMCKNDAKHHMLIFLPKRYEVLDQRKVGAQLSDAFKVRQIYFFSPSIGCSATWRTISSPRSNDQTSSAVRKSLQFQEMRWRGPFSHTKRKTCTSA